MIEDDAYRRAAEIGHDADYYTLGDVVDRVGGGAWVSLWVYISDDDIAHQEGGNHA